MNEKKTQADGNQEDLLIVELDERVEFGAAMIDGGLDEGLNSDGCINTSNCIKGEDLQGCVVNVQCINASACC